MSTWITRRAKELGIPTVDAKAPLFLEVVASDIKRAVQKNPTCCAFANATKRGIPGVQRVYFFRSCAWIEYEDRMIRYLLPNNLRAEVDKFDKTKTMAPGIYGLASPKGEHTIERIHARNKRRKGKRAAPKQKTKRVAVAQNNVVVTRLGNTKAQPTRPDEAVDVRSTNPAKWPSK